MAGFQYVSNTTHADSGSLETYHVDAAHSTLLAVGDVVVITGTAHTDGVNEVDTGNATTLNTGVIDSVDFTIEGEALTETGLLASTAGTVKVRAAQDATYAVDADATVTAAQVGLNVGINVTTATKSGSMTISNMNVDTATAATTVTLPFKIKKLLRDSAGTLGARVLVAPNATTITTGAAGI